MSKYTVKQIIGRQIIDSRGNPTVEADVILTNGTVGRGAAPSGASTGKFEAIELRDNDKSLFGGKGVSKAVDNINAIIDPELSGVDPADIFGNDKLLISLDGTSDKSKLGANAIIAVSIALANAAANMLNMSLYRFIGGKNATQLPVPMMNILNGGVHATNTVDIQEFMIMPIGAERFSDGLRQCTEVYHKLREILKTKGLSTSVGDEGGFAPNLTSDEQAILNILEAIKQAGYKDGKDFVIAIDAASSEWKNSNNSKYIMSKSGTSFTSNELIEYWKTLTDKYPIVSLEDGIGEEDWDGWKKLTSELGNSIQLVGDDLFVTNVNRLAKGIAGKCGNSILIKPNQIGTVSETLNAVQLAHDNNYTAVLSHRSGETEDTTIADLAVALNTKQIKTGAPCRAERTAKYNRLLRIEEELGSAAYYSGKSALKTWN